MRKALIGWLGIAAAGILMMGNRGIVWAEPPAEKKEVPATQPDSDPGLHSFTMIVRQAVIDSFAIPKIKDGKVEGMSVRTNAMLQFVVDEYKHRVGEHAEGPACQTLVYSVVAYDKDRHDDDNIATGTGVMDVKGCPPAHYSMVVMGAAEAVTNARLEAVFVCKGGGFYRAHWNLEWTEAGWHVLLSSTPSEHVEARFSETLK